MCDLRKKERPQQVEDGVQAYMWISEGRKML